MFVNNAGIALHPGTEFDSDRWRRMVDINLTAVIEGTRLAIAHLKENKIGGTVLNVASAGTSLHS